MNATPEVKPKPLYDSQAVIEAVRLLIDADQITELRALEATTAKDRWPHTASGYFDDADKLAVALAKIKTAKGIYITPNPIDPALLARAANRIRKTPKGESTQDSNILRRRWLLIDTDPQRPSGISATDVEHEAALQRARAIYAYLRDLGWPDPIAADSGNGSHLLYHIDVPSDDNGQIERCLKSLAARFDDDAVKVDQTVSNPARIWKLYGTLACKGDDTPDRPHRMARILNRPDELRVVDDTLLEALAAELPSDAPAHMPHHNNGVNPSFDLEAFIGRNNLDVDGPADWRGRQGIGKRWVLNRSPLCDHGGDGPFIIRHTSGAITARCHHNSCGWTWADLRRAIEPVGNGQPRRTGDSPANVAQSDRPAAQVERFQPFPTDALPEPIRGFVAACGKAIGCDPSYLALPLLTALGAAIGNARRVQLKRSWTVPAIIWTAIVGESGTAKTPAFKLVMRPTRERQRKALEQHAETLRRYDADLARWDKTMAEWKRDKKAADDPPEKPEAPQAERFIVSDTTVEALAPLLLANPRGLLLARDELAGWIGSFDRYAGGKGGGDAAHWLSMHNGESIIVDRKSGNPRTIYVPQASVAITGGIQPAILHRALGIEHRESGLAARLLLACPPRKAKRWTEADIDPAAEAEIAELLDRLFELQPTVSDEGELLPLVVGLTPEAKAAWKAYYNAHAQEQADLTGELSAAWSKLEEYAARLALVVHFTRWAADDPTLQSPDVVDVASINAGIRLAEWFKHETRRVYALLAESDDERDRRRLVEWIERKGGLVTAREMQMGCRWLRQAGAAEAALNELAKAGCGNWEPSPAGQRGQPTRRFRLSTVSTVNGNSPTPDKTTIPLTLTPLTPPKRIPPMTIGESYERG